MARPSRARVIIQHRSTPVRSGGAEAAPLTRLRRGACVLSSEWEELFTEGRLRTRVAAIEPHIENPSATVALQSAAAMHGLPVYRASSDRVDLIVPGRTTRHNSSDVIRHHMALSENDVVIVDGCRVTSLERTVYDVIRLVSLEAALVCFDAALRLIAWNAGTNAYDVEAAERFRRLVCRRVEGNAGARGIRQARFVTDFADGRAQLPGESVSRLWMWQLGLPRPELQYRVDFPNGSYVLLDFAWPRLSRWAEFDGLAKYRDDEILAGRSVEDVLRSQARRERKTRAFTGWRCDRWGFEAMPTIDVFAAHLRSLGLYAG